MFESIVVGINIKGDYVTVRRYSEGYYVTFCRLEELGDVSGIYFKKCKVGIEPGTRLSGRICKTLLSSFEDDLVLIDSIEIVDEFSDDAEDVVCLEIYYYDISYDSYTWGKNCAKNSDEFKSDVPDMLSISFENKKEEWEGC